MRRMTTGFVFTLSATCSDLRGSSPDQAIKLKTCTATANLLFVDISNCPGNHEPPFCNHYSYKFDFVNYLSVLGFLPQRSTKVQTRLSFLRLFVICFCAFCDQADFTAGVLRSLMRLKRTSTSMGLGTRAR